MKDSTIDTQLRLHKLEMISNSIDDAVMPNGPVMYDFEITNMADSELSSSDSDKKSDTKKSSDTKNTAKSAKKVNDLEPVDIEN